MHKVVIRAQCGLLNHRDTILKYLICMLVIYHFTACSSRPWGIKEKKEHYDDSNPLESKIQDGAWGGTVIHVNTCHWRGQSLAQGHLHNLLPCTDGKGHCLSDAYISVPLSPRDDTQPPPSY